MVEIPYNGATAIMRPFPTLEKSSLRIRATLDLLFQSLKTILTKIDPLYCLLGSRSPKCYSLGNAPHWVPFLSCGWSCNFFLVPRKETGSWRHEDYVSVIYLISPRIFKFSTAIINRAVSIFINIWNWILAMSMIKKKTKYSRSNVRASLGVTLSAPASQNSQNYSCKLLCIM